MKSKTFQFILFILIVLACIVLGKFFHLDIDYYRNILAGYPSSLVAIIFVVLYIITTTVIWLGPKDILRLLAAILFGPYLSTIFVTLGELGNTVIFFQLSRKLGRGFVEQKFKIKSGELDTVKERSGFLWALALRSNPLIPSNLLDLGFGLSSINFLKYFLIVAIISPFRVFLGQYVLAALGESVFKSPTVMIDFFLKTPAFFIYGVSYLLIVGALTVMAGVVSFVTKK